MPLMASGILNFDLMRLTVCQSSPAWNARPCTRRRPAVAKRPRAERDRIERHAVAPQGGLRFRTADDVVPIVLVQVLPRLGDELMQVEQVARLGGDVVDRARLGHGIGLGMAFLHAGPSRWWGDEGARAG